MCVQGGLVNRSWCTGVVSHSHGGGGGQECGTKPGGIAHLSAEAGTLHKHEVETLMSLVHTTFHVHSSG